MRKCNSALLLNCIILFISISAVTCTEKNAALSLTNNNITQKSQNATFNNITVPVPAKSQEKVVVIGEGGVTVSKVPMDKSALNNNSSVKSNSTINSKDETILTREETNPSVGVKATTVLQNQNTSKIKPEDSMKNMNPPKLGREGVSEEVKPKIIATKLGLDNFPTPETPTIVKEPPKTSSESPKLLDKPVKISPEPPKPKVVEQQESLQASIPTTDNHTLTASNKTQIDIEKPPFEVPKKNDGLKSVPRKGVSYPFDNVTTSSTTTVRPRPKKPLLTEASDDMPPVVGPPEPPDIPSMEHYSEQKVHRSADYIVPIVAVILSVPLVAIILSVLYKRGAEWWQHRHYRRMDFLIEGMYNN